MTEKEIIQKIYEAIKLVDCMQYNPLVDFNYLRAKGAYNVIKNQVEHIEAEAEYWEKICKFESVEYHTTIKNAAEHARHLMQERDEYKHRAEVAERALLTACIKMIKDEKSDVNIELLARVIYRKYLNQAENELTEEKKG